MWWLAAALLLACAVAIHPTRAQAQSINADERDRRAPFDYGFGPNVPVPGTELSFWNRIAYRMLAATRINLGAYTPPDAVAHAIARLSPHPLDAPVTGGPNAGTTGAFGPVLPWPIIPLHMALLPDGRVMTYGTNELGRQGAALWYDVWDPTQPSTTSHTILPNTTSTDIFCSGISLLQDGTLLITGGDLTIDKVRNYSNGNVNIFSGATNALAPSGTMAHARWYPSDVPLPNGDQLIIGGRETRGSEWGVTTPEYYATSTKTFTPLIGIDTAHLISWYYPKTFVGSNGLLYVFDPSGAVGVYSTEGAGSFSVFRHMKGDPGVRDLPTVMYAPGKLLAIRGADPSDPSLNTAFVDALDISGPTPILSRVASLVGGGRQWSNLTVLADGTAFANGGSAVRNQLIVPSYVSQIYNPATGQWTAGARAAQPRLYHSASLLLPDGTVLTGGGGAPGPIRQLNTEIYYPPYLFLKDHSGNLAPRPTILSVPPQVAVGSTFTIAMQDATPMGNVTMLRLGAETHSTNLQSRFIQPQWTQTDNTLSVVTPTNVNDFLPGFWMVFVFNSAGVPSIAQIFQVPVPTPPAN